MATHTDKTKNKLAEGREMALTFVGIEDDAYDKMFFDTAVEWAERFVYTAESASYILSQGIFWGWWRLEFDRVQDKFMEYFHFDEESKIYLAVKTDGVLEHFYDAEDKIKFFIEYMEKSMQECQSNTTIMELSFHKAIKQK